MQIIISQKELYAYHWKTRKKTYVPCLRIELPGSFMRRQYAHRAPIGALMRLYGACSVLHNVLCVCCKGKSVSSNTARYTLIKSMLLLDEFSSPEPLDSWVSFKLV